MSLLDWLLRALARLLIRGAEAPFVRADIDDGLERDVARGVGALRARWRYLVNIVLSAGSVARARLQRPRIRASWLDVRLALRMLVKHPVLTAASVFALAIGLPVGLAPMHVANVMERPLPEDPDGRLRLLRYAGRSTTLDDYTRWRDAETMFEGVAAVRPGAYTIEYRGDAVVAGAEVTASTFDLLGTEPLVGRRFTARDEGIGALPVAIVGHDLWRTRLSSAGDLSAVEMRIAGVPHRVIGVMPDGFMFPQRQQVWVPLRARVDVDPGDAPSVMVFARLSHGSTAEAAEAQLAAIDAAVPEWRAAVEPLTPEVVPMFSMTFGVPKGGFRAVPEYAIARVLLLVPLLVACVNVGLLIFARTATRTQEFAVRTALGASRARILTQVFIESLVLCLAATGIGLWLLAWVPGRVMAMADIPLPYWIDLRLAPSTIVWGLLLGVGSAALAGVVPVVRATGGGIQRAIQRARAARSGERFGGRSGILIAADVAVAVAALGLSAAVWQEMHRPVSDGVQAERYLSFELRRATLDGRAMDAGASGRLVPALIERIEAEPGVRGVAAATALPRMDHRSARIELEEGEALRSRIRIADVAPGFFAAFDRPILFGRAFDERDVRDGSRAIIVNTSFVQNILGGSDPVGRRVRLVSSEREPLSDWYEIVGVVGHLGMRSINPDLDEGIYRPVAPERLQPLRMAIDVAGDPTAFASRLREIVREIDPAAAVSGVSTLDRQVEGDWYVMASIAVGGLVFVCVLLALAASSIYAIMSFAVAERTREIGIRVALGAARQQIVWHVVRRALMQIGAGVALGMIAAAAIFFQLQRDASVVDSAWLAVGVALLPGLAILCLVALIACAAPTRRALRISPVEALKGG